MITSSNVSFEQTVRVDFVGISKIRQNNHYVKQEFIRHQKYTIANG